MHNLPSEAAGFEKGFVKYFLRVPQAAQASKENFQKTFYKTFFTTCRPRCTYRGSFLKPVDYLPPGRSVAFTARKFWLPQDAIRGSGPPGRGDCHEGDEAKGDVTDKVPHYSSAVCGGMKFDGRRIRGKFAVIGGESAIIVNL